MKESTPSRPADGGEVTVDLEALHRTWPDGPEMATAADAFRVVVDLGKAGRVPADTHLFGAEVEIVPYADDDRTRTANGKEVARGDAEVARRFPPGQIGFAIKHHRPAHRLLSAADAEADMKENLKLQDTHIELVVGVERDGEAGALTINNPQDYQSGRFGDADYPMVFTRPTYPAYLPADVPAAFNDNIRTLMACFNTVSEFPGNYNGGDPLGASTPALTRDHVRQMLLALAGDGAESQAAWDWFKDPAQMIYCAELAHVSASAGLLLPLNAAYVVPLIGEPAWRRFNDLIAAHNAGDRTILRNRNKNSWIRWVKLTAAPDDLLPVSAYAPAAEREAEAGKLAFQPLTMSDIVRFALEVHFPRRDVGESIAPLQAAVLAKMRPGLFETMAIDHLDPSDPGRQPVEALYDEILAVVGTPHADYDAFRTEVNPLLERARQMTGPRPGSGGAGLYVPPSTLHVVAQGRHEGGLLGLDYVGHGLHWSLLRAGDMQ